MPFSPMFANSVDQNKLHKRATNYSNHSLFGNIVLPVQKGLFWGRYRQLFAIFLGIANAQRFWMRPRSGWAGEQGQICDFGLGWYWRLGGVSYELPGIWRVLSTGILGHFGGVAGRLGCLCLERRFGTGSPTLGVCGRGCSRICQPSTALTVWSRTPKCRPFSMPARTSWSGHQWGN